MRKGTEKTEGNGYRAKKTGRKVKKEKGEGKEKKGGKRNGEMNGI